MPRERHFQWYESETGKWVCHSSDLKSWNVNPTCPICGSLTHYWEGMVDQDRMGNDLHGYTYDCHTCHINTEPVTID